MGQTQGVVVAGFFFYVVHDKVFVEAMCLFFTIKKVIQITMCASSAVLVLLWRIRHGVGGRNETAHGLFFSKIHIITTHITILKLSPSS